MKKRLINYLKESGFSDDIIKAFKKTDRSKFVPLSFKAESYENIPLSIGYGQTISQPYTIAFMLNLLEIKSYQKILEVGSGSGYVLELIYHLSPKSKIFGIERIKELAENSKEKLKEFKNIIIVEGDGSKGLLNEAPFDRIIVSAASNKIPQELIKQLKLKGILVMPVKESLVVLKKDQENKITEYPGFVFVPLIEDY